MELLRDLTAPKLQASWAQAVRQRLRVDNYGTEWCVTDILRMPNRMLRLRVIDALLGIGTNGKPNGQRVPVMVVLRRIGHGQVTRSVVVGEPELLCYDEKGSILMQPSGRQVEHRAELLPERWSCPLASDIDMQSAILMLRRHGWMARDGGKPRRRYSLAGVQEFRDGRYVQSSQVAIDHWVLVEEAFELMHPDLGPPVSAGKADAPAAPVAAAPSATDAKERRREAARETARKWRLAQKTARSAVTPTE